MNYNALIKKETIVGSYPSSEKEYLDEKNIGLINDKEDLFTIITQAQYDTLSLQEKQNKVFLVTDATVLQTNAKFLDGFNVSTVINANSTNDTVPTSKTVVDSMPDDATRIKNIKVVSQLPDIQQAKNDTLYYKKDDNTNNYLQYYVYNESWKIVGVSKSIDDFVTKDYLPFKFGIVNNKYGYYNTNGTTFTEFAESFPENQGNIIYLGNFNSIHGLGVDMSQYGIYSPKADNVLICPLKDFNKSIGGDKLTVSPTSVSYTSEYNSIVGRSIYYPIRAEVSGSRINFYFYNSMARDAVIDLQKQESNGSWSDSATIIMTRSGWHNYDIYYKTN